MATPHFAQSNIPIYVTWNDAVQRTFNRTCLLLPTRYRQGSLIDGYAATSTPPQEAAEQDCLYEGNIGSCSSNKTGPSTCMLSIVLVVVHMVDSLLWASSNNLTTPSSYFRTVLDLGANYLP